MERDLYSDSLKAEAILSEVRCRYNGYLIFIAMSGIGDICYCLSAVEEIKRISGKKVLVITREYTSELLKFYNCVDEVIVLEDDDTKSFRALMSLQKEKSVFNKESMKSGLFFCHPLTEESYASIINKEKNYIDIIRKSIKTSGTDFPVTYPCVPEPMLEKFSFDDLSKAVIINPYSFSLDVDNSAIYGKIVSLLTAKGYTVYTNITEEQRPLDSTLPLKCSLQEIYHITKKARLFISIRSGIVDFSVSNNGTFIVLYNDEKSKWFRDAYSLDGWMTDSSIHEFDYKDEKAILDKINELC